MKLHIVMFTLLRMTFIVCITACAIKFHNAWLLLWYIVPAMLNLEVNIPPDDDNNQKNM